MASRPRPVSERPTRWRPATVAVLLGGLPAVALAVWTVFTGDLWAVARWTWGALILGAWLGAAWWAAERSDQRWRQLAGRLASLREGHVEHHAVSPARGLEAEAHAAIDDLAATLRAHRWQDREAQVLLEAVLVHVDAAIFTVDTAGRLTLANPAGAALFGSSPERLRLRPAAELGLGEALTAPPGTILRLPPPAAPQRFSVQRTLFRAAGREHTLLLLADVTDALRAEELDAWKRLVRVLGHELNNSLAPLQSVAEGLASDLHDLELAPDRRTRLTRGLDIIARRTASLTRFLEAYRRLARLPAPHPETVSAPALLHRLADLETRVPVTVESEDFTLSADPDQLEQALLNLVRNGAEAMIEAGATAPLILRAEATPGSAIFSVVDVGSGLAHPENLFVPFYSTKPEGSGIGLFLARQIAENHDGTLSLHARDDGPGVVARLILPRSPA